MLQRAAGPSFRCMEQLWRSIVTLEQARTSMLRTSPAPRTAFPPPLPPPLGHRPPSRGAQRVDGELQSAATARCTTLAAFLARQFGALLRDLHTDWTCAVRQP